MRRVWIGLAGLALVVAVVLCATWQPAQAQRPGGPQQQMFMQLRVVESYWTLLAFELKVDSETLAKVRPILQQAYDKRKAVFEEVRKGNRQALQQLRNFKQDIDTQLVKVLGEETFQALQDALRQQIRPGRPGGPGGPGGRRGARRGAG